MADASAVRLTGVASGAGTADGILHRQFGHHLPVRVREQRHPQHDAVAHFSVYAVVAQQSLGELLVGSIFPGLLLSGLYVAYVLVRCYIDPKLGPALPVDERVNFGEKLRLLKNTIAPILLIILVLGVIFIGIATPVEAAGIGTFGALFVSALHRRL